jgi:parvulin-like peptidyl-prolyl isomerase
MTEPKSVSNSVHRGRHFVIVVLLGLLAVFLALALFTVGVYRLGWDNFFTRAVAKTIPLPAAFVSGHAIYLSQVYERLGMAEKLAANPVPTKHERQQAIMNSLIDEQIIADLARKLGIVVTEDDLSRYYQYVLAEVNLKPQDAAAEIKKSFGVSEAVFQTQIVLPDLRRAKLVSAFLEGSHDSAGYQAAVAAGQDLSSGQDFAAIAAKYSQDETSKHIGGDIGFLTRDELPPWVSDQVFDLKVGEVSGIVVSSDGYHIYQVRVRDDRSNPGRLQLRQIFLKGPSFDEFLQKQRQNYRVYVFDKI